MGRKHCGKRRNCSICAISGFPTVFSKDLHCTHVKTRLDWERVKSIFSKCNFNPGSLGEAENRKTRQSSFTTFLFFLTVTLIRISKLISQQQFPKYIFFSNKFIEEYPKEKISFSNFEVRKKNQTNIIKKIFSEMENYSFLTVDDIRFFFFVDSRGQDQTSQNVQSDLWSALSTFFSF